MTVIYGLIDPRTDEMRYIGKAVDADKRYKGHMRDSRVRDTPVYRWIRKLFSMGMRPDMLVLSECDDWKSEERRLIASARKRGYSLLNVADGGDEPYCPPEIRAANGKRNAAVREADPKRKAVHRYLRNMGSILGQVKHWDEERRRKFSHALDAAKAMAKADPEAFYAWIAARGHG
jgi:hypothetical protein